MYAHFITATDNNFIFFEYNLNIFHKTFSIKLLFSKKRNFQTETEVGIRKCFAYKYKKKIFIFFKLCSICASKYKM